MPPPTDKDNNLEQARIEPTTGERVSSVDGYRMCESCGFQLFGTPIHREDRYGFLVIQCPECGHVHAASEPARLTKKRLAANRSATLFYLITKLVVIALSTGLVFGTSYGAAAASLGKYGRIILDASSTRFDELIVSLGSREAAAAQMGIPSWSIPNEGSNSTVVGPAWFAENADELREAHGGRLGVVDWTAFRSTSQLLAWLLVVGPVFAVVFPHLRTPALSRFIPLLCGLTAALAYYVAMHETDRMSGYLQYLTAYSAARLHNGWVPTTAAIFFAAIPLTLGFVFARPGARLLIRGLLRPELRDPFQDLWLLDGKTLPNTPKRPPTRR
ncbi:MAG: hypothetical protein AAF235_00925 [Planctomycetota bacterium]